MFEQEESERRAYLFSMTLQRTTGSNIEVKKASITWHYRQADPAFAEWQSKEMLNLLESTVVPRRPIEGERCMITVMVVRTVAKATSYHSHGGQKESRMQKSGHQQGRDCQEIDLSERRCRFHLLRW